MARIVGILFFVLSVVQFTVGLIASQTDMVLTGIGFLLASVPFLIRQQPPVASGNRNHDPENPPQN